MSLNTNYGLVRRTTVPNYADQAAVVFAANQRGELIVSQGLPSRAELVRQGNRWSTATPVANAFAPVAASPTTLANIVLYNNNAAGGKCLIVDAVWAYCQTSIAALSSIALLGQMGVAGIAAPTNNTAALVRSGLGATYAGGALKAIANTAFAIADMWEMLGIGVSGPAASIGHGAYADVFGAFIVPPGRAFCANLIASTAAGTIVQGISFFEVQLELNV